MKLKAFVGWVSMVLKWCFFQFHYRKVSYRYKNPTLNKVTKKKKTQKSIPAGNYIFKVKNRNTETKV